MRHCDPCIGMPSGAKKRVSIQTYVKLTYQSMNKTPGVGLSNIKIEKS